MFHEVDGSEVPGRAQLMMEVNVLSSCPYFIFIKALYVGTLPVNPNFESLMCFLQLGPRAPGVTEDCGAGPPPLSSMVVPWI